MDGFDLFDDDLTAAEATLLVAAIDDEDGAQPDRGAPGPAGGRADDRAPRAAGRPGNAAERSGTPERRAAGGCAGCGCLLAVVLPIALATAVAAEAAASLLTVPLRVSFAAAVDLALPGSVAGAATAIRAPGRVREAVSRSRAPGSGRMDRLRVPKDPLAWFRPIGYSWSVPTRRAGPAGTDVPMHEIFTAVLTTATVARRYRRTDRTPHPDRGRLPTAGLDGPGGRSSHRPTCPAPVKAPDPPSGALTILRGPARRWMGA